MRIYISGPITGTDDFEERFMAAEHKLKELFEDVEVINPTMIKLPDSCTHEEYMAIDFKLLDLCDAIYLLKGWQQSSGACMEYGYAKKGDHIILQEGKEGEE